MNSTIVRGARVSRVGWWVCAVAATCLAISATGLGLVMPRNLAALASRGKPVPTNMWSFVVANGVFVPAVMAAAIALVGALFRSGLRQQVMSLATVAALLLLSFAFLFWFQTSELYQTWNAENGCYWGSGVENSTMSLVGYTISLDLIGLSDAAFGWLICLQLAGMLALALQGFLLRRNQWRTRRVFAFATSPADAPPPRDPARHRIRVRRRQRERAREAARKEARRRART